MLESYITPLLMSYVDKYIKNLKPSDLSLSLWGGDVVLYNLELRLDVLEKELHLPITFLSGKIHKLQIHIPWTKLGSEPVEITISTLECVVQLKYPDHSPSDQSSMASEGASTTSENEKEDLQKGMDGKEEVPPSGYVQSLVNRVINNVSICVNNVILKYLEDDIVLSLNIKSAETFSVNSNWEKAFVDVVAPDFLLQKVCNISDLTICLDKRNSSGKIELYQDPLLYKCGLSCRMMLKFDSLLRPIETKFNVYCESADISLTDQQLPMFMRLATLCLSLYIGTLDLPGSEYKPHPAKRIVEQQAISNPNLSFTSEPQEVSTQTGSQQNVNDEDWVNWMWSLVPNLTDDQSAQLATPPPTPLLLAGFYVSHVTITIKLTGKVSDGNFFGGQRFEFKPMLSFELSGGAGEMVMKGDEFFDAQLGVSSIMGWCIGDCVCQSLDVSSSKEGIEADDKEDVFITIASHKEDSSDSSGFLAGSLFDNGERSSLEIPDLTFDAEEFLKVHNENLALRRYGAFFADYLYAMEIEPERDQATEENQLEGLEVFGEIRVVKEMSFKRLIVGPAHLQLSTSMMHRMELVLKLSFDDIVPRKEKCEPYYDEFIEKQLLAGNIPAQNSSITLVSFTATLPAADHGKMPLGPPLQNTNSTTELHTVSSQLSLQSIPDVEDTDAVPKVVCIVQISRIDVQVTEPMYPTELTKLAIANAEYPAGKAMLMCTYSDVSAQFFGIQVSVMQLQSDVTDMPLVNIIPPLSMAGSSRFCILPESWGGADLLKREAHVEVPNLQILLTKPQFVLMSHIVDSWASSLTKGGKMAPIPRAVVDCVFYPNDQDSVGGIQPELQFKVSNIQMQFCETQSVVGASGSVGTVFASLKSCDSGTTETTALVKGPYDTSEMYTGNLFRSAHLQENFIESTGPALSFTVQLPQAAIRCGDPVAQPAPPSGDQLSGMVLFHLKGITACLDPLLYEWICYKSPAPTVTPRHKAERERTKTIRHQSLPKTPSATTPRKKTFARGYGSVASPAKEEKTGSKQDESPTKQSPPSESPQETVDGRKMFENWLFDKLSFITAMELQVHIKSAVLFLPEKHIAHELETNDIACTFSTQSLKTTNNSFPPTLVICLPNFKLLSANHEPMSVRQSLPVKTHHKDATRRETLPWTLEAENLAVYSVYVKKISSVNGRDYQPVVHYLLSKVSSTAVLASARTSSVPSSPTLAPLQFLKPSGAGGRRVSTLGFCVHTDFQPIEVSCCGKQMQLVANLLEGLLSTCFLTSTSSVSADTTSGMPTSVTHTTTPDMKRTTSLTSSSCLDQVESEITQTESVSSMTFSQVQQPSKSIRVSLWLQWTLPRVVTNLYSRSAVDHSAVCVCAELEDLTASVDYSDAMLQMQCKIGAFNVSHFMQRCLFQMVLCGTIMYPVIANYDLSSDGFWELGHFNGILLSCNDVISSKSLFTSARRPSSGRRENPGPGAHGFLTVMYKRSSLHLKRRRSSSVERTGKEEDQYKDQHEIHVNIQPFDVVLWCPAIVSALNVFDLGLLEKFRFLSEHKTVVEKTESVFLPKNDEEGEKAESVTVNVELLPLLFVNMRNLRLFIPSLLAGKDPNSAQGSGRIRSQEDMAVVQLSTVAVSPHPDNPNSRKVLNREFYEKFRKFGRSSRQALGYDIHDVQYQIDLCGFGVWTGSWEQLCGEHKHENDQELVGIAVDQNPALEWNTQMWRGTEEVHVTQIISGSDFRVVLAPAISVEKYVAVDRLTVSERIQVCGWSLEFNVVTDVDCFLNKAQIQLLQTLSAENLKTLSGSLKVPLNESAKTPSDSSVARSPDDVFLQSVDRIDSGFESARSNLSTKFRKDRSGTSKFPLEEGSPNTYKPPGNENEVPWEVFVTGRRLTAAVYSQFLLDDKPAERVFTSKQNLPVRDKFIQIKPVLRVELVHPALIVNTQSSDPRIQVSCFDISITGPSTEKVFKPLPDPADYPVDWLKSGVGLPDPYSGILPSLVTVDITDFLCGKADVFVELGRSLHLNLNLEMAKEIKEFLNGLVVPSEEHVGAKGTQMRASGRTLFFRSFCLSTSEIFIHLEPPPIPGKPKLLGSVLGVKSKVSLKSDQQGHLKRADTSLQLHGVGLSTSVNGRCRSLIHPFSSTVDLEMVWEPHSRDLYVQSDCGVPQLYAVMEAGYVQVDVGQEHVTCLSLLADLVEKFTSPSTVKQETEEPGIHKRDFTPEKPERVVLFESFDDIRAGCFRYITTSGEEELHHPEPWEVVFTSDFSERPPAMTWRYPEPRALSAVDMVPLPLSTPVLVNTLNMGDEYQVPCVLRYWDPTQKCFITYKEFTLSENNATCIQLPDPSTAHPAEVIVAAEWQMVVDVTVDIEYPDDRSHDGDFDVASSYASPYRSLLSAASLAASVKVNSVVRPDLNPALSAQLNISVCQVKFTNHLYAIGRAVPQYLTQFTMDPFLPMDQEFLLLTVEGLSGVIKDVGGTGGFLQAQAEWNCNVQVLDYGDLTYRPLLSPFDVGLTATMYHVGRTMPPGAKDAPTAPPVWIDASLEAGTVLAHVSQSTIHTIALSITAWGQTGQREAQRVILNHYVICNDTNEALRFGQVDTDESLLLMSRHVHAYSWRTPHTVKASPRLHVCIETERDWRWSEPFDIDTVGVFSRTIHHRLHSATLFIEVKQLSGMQKQIIIRGSHIIVSRLSIDVGVQILTNPSLNAEQSSKARYQVLEDVSLPANTALPSYVISHGGLAGMRIRIPNDTTWSEALPLECGDEESNGHHCIVQLLGVKDFQTFYFWYNLEKPGSPDQIKVTLSPLFVMRSHLPEPVLMNVLTANTNSASVLQLQGRAREQHMYSLVPNSWHQLTFQFTGSSKWSSPSVPLNTTLIELADRMDDSNAEEEDRPLADIWPYCKYHKYFRRCDTMSEKKPESSLVKNVSLGGHVDEEKKHLATQIDTPHQDMRANPSSVPAIEVQCRVVKRWPHLSSLLVEVLPWCLLVNNVAAHVIIRDLERDVDVDLPSGSVLAPHRITGKVKFGAYFGNKDCSWSEAVSLPSDTPSSQETSSNDIDEGLSVPIAFVLSSGEILGARWTVTSRMCRGIKIISVRQRFQVINNFGKPLMVHPVLVTSGQKIPVDNVTRATAVCLSNDPKQFTPITTWDVLSSTAVVFSEKGESSFNGQTSPVLFLALEKELYSSANEVKGRNWSRAVLITPEIPRQSVAVSVDDSATLPVVVTSHVADGVVNIVISPDPSPRLFLQNDCPFTLQFGQAIPPQSPSHVSGSPEKIVVVEQMQGLGEIPVIMAFSSTYYELPVMREWFATTSEVQRLPELHIQALYDVKVAEISEEEGERGELAAEMTTEVPQGWSYGFDLNTRREMCVNLPGRGQVLLTVTQERLCTYVKVQPSEEDCARASTVQCVSPVSPVIYADLFICQLGVTIIDEVTNFRNPYEVFRITTEGISVKHAVEGTLKDGRHDFRDLSLCVGAVQVDNQLQDDVYEFSVILTPSSAPMTLKRVPSQRRPGHRSRAKPLVNIKIVYEPGPCAEDTFLSSVCVTLQPLTMYIEDTFLYRLGDLAVSFLPPLLYLSSTSSSHLEADRQKTFNAACSNVRPILMGELKITPVTLSVTLHGSAKLFLSVDDSPLSLGQFHLSPVYLPSSALVQKLTYHYATAALFKAGWVLGSLELLGNPAGLVRSFSQGVADFFYLPYDGLTRGPGAFVSGMSRGLSSFVRHLSTGALTSITSLASSMARNLDRLSMDSEYLRLLEEQRCRKPKKVLTGLSKGLGGFGLSLLGAVAGIVDQPIQGIRRANDVREAASGVITGVGKGLIGVVTKPLGGAMELVSQTGQGILQGAGLTELPNRLFDPGETLAFSAKNSHLKYFWKMLHNQSDLDLLLHLDATVVTSSGHGYDGTVLLTRDTLFIVGQASDTIQQTLFIRDIDLQEDEEDNRSVAIVNQVVIAKDESEEVDGVHDSGDPDRLRQFLKDARAQALEQMATLDSSDRNFTSPGQKFVLLVDPMLRKTLMLQFQSAKKNCISNS